MVLDLKMEYKELELLADEGYDIHKARILDYPYRNITATIETMVSRSSLKERKGLLFFSRERLVYVIPDGTAQMNLVVRGENFVLGVSDSTYIPMIYTPGMVIYSPSDNSSSNFTRIEFPFLHTALSVVESGGGIEIYFFEDEEIPFARTAFWDIDNPKVRRIKDRQTKGERLPERYVHLKHLNHAPVFYLPNAKVKS